MDISSIEIMNNPFMPLKAVNNYLLLIVILIVAGCTDSTFSVDDNSKTPDIETRQDTIVLPHYGTIDIIIPQREASVVNVEGYTGNSFLCRVDLTKEAPITSGGGISDDWIITDYNVENPLWQEGIDYYNNGQMYHYSETKEGYYNDQRNNGSVNGIYDGLRKSYLHYDWPIDKTKHRGQVRIDIPGCLDETYYADISFQGQSSIIWYPKKNFRIRLYRDETYKKKQKIKIGDMIECSGYNVKAYYIDPSRLVEPIIYAMIHKVYKTYDYQERYPWNKSNPIFNGATGTVKGFPVKLTVNGEFYGVEYFGEKKDKGNYLLDGNDASGLFVQGVGYQSDFWDIFTSSRFEDQMIDEDDKETPWVEGGTTTQSNVEALTAFYDYFNNHLEKETAEKHFNKKAWIDYMIFCQLFHMFDNMWNNIILYSDADKTQFSPFFYDLDMSLREVYKNSNLDVYSIAGDAYYNHKTFKGIWLKLKDLWWEEIVERYKFLRQEVLTIEKIKKIAYDIKNGIVSEDFENEIMKWQNVEDASLNNVLNVIEKRLIFCDDYFVNLE